MYDSRIQYAIDNLIVEDYFLPMNNQYQLEEDSESGKSLLHIIVDAENICVEKYNNKKRCGFVQDKKSTGMKKCINHFI